MYAEVIVDISAESVDRVFTYRVPEGITVTPGWRVEVPFGRLRREGFVVGLRETTDLPPDRVKPILATLEDYPALCPPLMDLAHGIAERFHCPLSMALRLMIPAEMRGSRVRVKEEQVIRLTAAPEAEAAYVGALNKRQFRKRMLMTLLKDRQEHPLSEVRDLVKNPLELVRELSELGLITVTAREVLRAPLVSPAFDRPVPALTDDQQEAVEELLLALKNTGASRPAGAPRDNCYLLRGVTGSGKTEVYMRLTEECLKKDRGVILLVPEIALTGQMVDWFRSRFGAQAAVLHSRLSAGERYDEWRRIRKRQARLVIGARSAVFAPVEDLGAIIIDEEHEPTFQNEHYPQYDAREIARMRARRENALVLMGSATPSIYSFAMARRGDFTLLELRHRANGLPLPRVSVVDMRRELELGNRSIFSAELAERLDKVLSQDEQAILFINRRGYAPSVTCRACGETVQCPRCDVSMTLHRQNDMMLCHYCGHQAPLPRTCPKCGSGSIRPVGIGTQRVEEELLKRWPGVRVLRMDMDTTQKKDAHHQMVNAFRARQAQVLVGTQMIAKGLDFPNVTLVGAVLADLSLNMPDYRAAERTFQLLTQVAGRAGRAEKPGYVVIQTYKPDHYALQAAASQDYLAYFDSEFQRRRRQLYPPFTIIARFLIDGEDREQALKAAVDLKERVEKLTEEQGLKKRLLFIRADDAPIKYIDGRCRTQTLMKWLSHADSERLLNRMMEWTAQNENGLRITLEINPAQLA